MTPFTKFVLLQVPGWMVAACVAAGSWLWASVPSWIAGGLFALWVLKDFAFYPLVRVAYQSNTKTGAEQLVGCTGVARETLNPDGYIRVRGELWRAEAYPPGCEIPVGNTVVVKAARQLTLIVTAETAAEGDAPQADRRG